MCSLLFGLLVFAASLHASIAQTNACLSRPCQNGADCHESPVAPGYVCFCIGDWIGQDCEMPKAQLIPGARRGCDETIYQERNGSLTSPRWPDPYIVNQICYYQIKFPNADSIRLNWEFFNTEVDKDELYFNEGPTPPEIRDDPDVLKFSGELLVFENMTRTPLVFETNQLTLVWESDRNLVPEVRRPGFRFTFIVDVDDCFRNQCQGSSVCIDQQDGFVCFCPPSHVGEFCEFGLVPIAITQPQITTGTTLVEGTLFYAFNFDLTLTPATRAAFDAVGINLWRVHVFLSRSPDGSGQELVSFDPFLSQMQAAVSWLPPANTVLPGIQAFFTLSELTCSDGWYFCATIDRSSTADFVIRGDPTNVSLTGCTPFNCRGVEISATAIRGLSNVNIRGMQQESFNFDLSLTSVAGAGSVDGTNLWHVVAFASPFSDGSTRIAETDVTLSSLMLSVGVTAGTEAVLADLDVTLPLQGVDCTQLRFLCVEIQRNPQSSPRYTLVGIPNDNVLVTCQQLMCGAVEVFQMSFMHMPAMILANSPSNMLTFDLTANTLPSSATVSGVNLWRVDIFTSTNINGIGTTAFNQTIVLPQSVANTPILQPGDVLMLSNFATNLDLTGLTCAEIPYICLALRRNVLSEPVFQLEGIPSEGTLTSCRFIPCSVFLQCSDITCNNGGTCQEGPVGEGPSCICPPGWTGATCDQATNACDGVMCLFGGTCIDNQFSFVCLCPLGREGVLCEEMSTGVVVQSVTPITENAILREGVSINALNLGVSIQTDARSDSVSGTGLWSVNYFLNSMIDGTGERIDLQTSSLTSGQASTAVAAGSTASITGVFTLADLERLTCSEVPYICAELSKGEDPNPDFLLTGSLVGCATIDCTGVEVTNSQLQFITPPVIVERSTTNALRFNYIFSSSSTGGSVTGDNLWSLVWYLSTLPDEIGGSVQTIPITLTPLQSGVDLSAGSTAAIQSVTAVVDAQQFNCDEFEYICVRLQQNPAASLDFMLSATSEGALADCARVTCRGVEVTALTPSYISPPQLQSGESNFINFNLQVSSSVQGASVSGMDLWTVEIFTNTNQNGDGITRAEAIATIPAASLHQGITAGSNLILRDIRASLDLTSLTCTDIPYICVRLSRNQLSDPTFTLENANDREADIIQCMTFACNDPQPCDVNPCLNGGQCNFEDGVLSCICPEAFFGDFCENVNPCFGVNPCQNSGTCIPIAQVFICLCDGGFTGDTCEIPPDPCLSGPCLNGGTCIRQGTTSFFQCICTDFFEGEICQLEDPCGSSPCLNGGTCLGNVQTGTYQCVCPSEYKGDMCQYPEPCSSSPCLNNGVCVSDVTGSSYSCTCQPGLTGQNCETPDPCFSSPCLNGGVCRANAQGTSFVCDCPPGFEGILCQFSDPCFSSPCQNGATCVPDFFNSQFTCICSSNFIGMFCQFQDRCASMPCLNQGTCINSPETGSFQCLCRESFIGDVCQNSDPCLSTPCLNGGTCSSSADGSFYLCSCPTTFIGTNCEIAVACSALPCSNGGTCLPSQDGLSFMCICPLGYLLPDCRARDPCFINPCQNGGVCSLANTPQRYSCDCLPGYLGDNCHNLDPCLSSPCQQGGTCTALSQGIFYQCVCPPNTFGINCENMDPCLSDPCDNGGTCRTSGDFSAYSCICPSGFIGLMCQVRAPCTDNPCMFGGTCINDQSRPAGFLCLCETGRVGDTCDGLDVCALLSPCFNQGTCVPNTEDGTFMCICREGFTGATCQIGNPCENNPCLFGGTCVPSGGSYVCLCVDPYTGTNCEDRLPTQEPPPCQEGSQFTCVSGECISLSQRCDGLIHCADGFFDEIGCPPPCNSLQFGCLDGSVCIPLSQLCDDTPNCGDGSDEAARQCSTPCESNPCLNGGSCLEPTPTTFSCSCTDDYTGVFCESTNIPANDPPEFTSPSEFVISEDAPLNSVVITLTARDLNSDTLEFGLQDDLQLFYMLDLSSGQIFLQNVLDREVYGDSINFTAIVRDSQGARTSQLITVIIEDVNDNAPMFTNLPERIELPENTTRGEIYQVVGSDLDEGLNALLSYRIESVSIVPSRNMSTANLFAVNTATGAIFLTHTLDFETTQQYVITIVTQDQGPSPLSTTGILTVDVLDIQDQGPVFLNTPYDRTIPETQMVQSVVQTVEAVDQDITNPQTVVYALISGNQGDYFMLDTASGDLRLIRGLDRDNADVPSIFTLTVRASEVDFPSNSVTNTFNIIVSDVQDEPPAFNEDIYEATVSEDAGAGSVLPLTIFVTDQDRTTGDLISLQLQGPDDLPFTVSPLTVTNEGAVQITVSGQLDYEETQSYEFMLVATETSADTGESYTATSTVVVNIQDVNDNDPVFTQDSFAGSVSEGASVGTLITTVDATDRDSNLNAQISYSIVQGNEEGLFRINSMTGEISTQSPSIDFESSQMRYTIVIEATNPTVPVPPAVGFSRVEVTIDVVDTNDNSPVFDRGNYNTSIIEIADPGFGIIRVSATDADTGPRGEVRYSINGGNAGGVFEIDEVTGDITLRTSVDREIRDFYSLTVVATDQADPNNIGLTTVDITIRDFNDNDPVWQQISYDMDVSEGATNGTFIIQVEADDVDIGSNARLTYSLGPDNPYFVIDPDTGEIFLNGMLDRETNDEITLNVIVTDNGNPNRPAATPATVTIRVTDTNDNPPVFVDLPYNLDVTENQPENTLVGQVFISDVDLVGTHTFSILNRTDGFRIDSATGEIFTTGPFDREYRSYYQLVVAVSDGVAMETVAVNVTINDINDNDPVFDRDEYSLSVSEDFPLLVEILTLNATDLDEVDDGDISFRFVSGRNVEGPFTLDRTTGLLELISSLDRELQSMYTLTVLAVDTMVGGMQRTGTTTILIEVTDVNDNGPQFTQNPYPEETVPEDVGEGVPIAQVSTTDEDLGNNSAVMYRITQGNVGNIFTIDGNGVISRGSTPLDRETLDFYLLVVEAFDPTNPDLPTDSAVVTIVISDVNDVVPRFTQSVYSRLDLTEDTEIGTLVTDVQAQDQDLGLAGMVQYSIVEGNEMGFFTIDSTSGAITTRTEFPSISSTMTFNLTVQAVDQSSPFNVGVASVIVTILDAGEIPPVFVLPRYEVDSIENLESGTFVVQVQALVENRPANLLYSLDPNAHPDVIMHFEVNETTGEITIKTPLDREAIDFFAFTVFAEGETVSSSTAVWVTVLDANDNTPTFIEYPEDVTVLEGLPAQTVVGEIRTTDDDINQNAIVNYRISDGNREGAFTLRIREGSVEIITTRPLNREFTDEYNITITAFDSGIPSLSSSQFVHITVGDANDNPPFFTASTFNVEVMENTLTSQPITAVAIMDNDEPANNDHRFTIIQGDEEGRFVINDQGEISLTGALDRERMDSYQLTVRLEDPSYDPRYQVFVPVDVTVLDENDNAPVFSEPSYQARVSEGVSSAIVTTVAASDLDLGPNSEIRFNVTGANAEYFSIDPIQGILITEAELDRESVDEYLVTITATDQAIDPLNRLTATTTVTVDVTDINDTPPFFVEQQYGPYNILEESPNAFIDTIQAMDLDLGRGGTVMYALIGQFRDYFVINPFTGLLTVNPNRPLDYEEEQQINITVVARDADGLQSMMDVTVNVININDNSPQFEDAPYSIAISENVAMGTLAFIAVATDADLGSPGVVTYSIVDGNEGDIFWINPQTGEIYVNRTLDRETVASYNLILEANDNPDNTDDTRTTTTTLSIEVSDADDVPPTFPNDRYFGSILENEPVGTLIDMDRPIRAVDSDEVSVIMYSIRNNDSSLFIIDPVTGELRSQAIFDREVRSLYTFIVRATDSQGSYAEARVEVTVINDNDNEPRLALDVYNFTIPENSATGVFVGQLNASDGDGDTISFSIVSGAEGLFVIDPETGIITVAPRAVLDREERSSYTLTIAVTDQGSPQMTTTGTVNIDLSDINDSPPIFEETDSSVTVSEADRGSSIGIFIANDPDLDAVLRYSIDSVTILDNEGRDITSQIDFSTWFMINETTGEVTLLEQVDREAISEINVAISATDENGDGETRMSNPNAMVQIVITDTNDNAPVIGTINVNVLQEESSVGTIITTVTAEDPDQGEGGVVTYRIVDGAKLPITIDPVTGVVTVNGTVDRELFSWVNFTIIALDNGVPSLNSTVDVNLRITDINDNNPSFNQTMYTASVNESTSVGECFTRVIAQDADDADFGLVTYSLSRGEGIFEIDPETGEICLADGLDRESVSQYTLIVTAKDNPGGSPNNRRETSTTVVVDITDTNEFAPRSEFEFPYDLLEGEPIGTVVGTIEAVDPDTPDQPLIYTIGGIQPSGGENLFMINRTTGEIILIGEIDAENSSFADQYRINIIISDGGNPELTTDVVSVITIRDINDTPPTFDPSYYNISVSEDYDTSNPVLTVSATDPDENTVLTYMIVDGNEDGSFLIISNTGEIRFLGMFDHETREMYQLTVSVTDQDGLESTALVDIYITDILDHEPRFTQTIYTFSVLENEPNGTMVGTILARDNNVNQADQGVIYSIIGGNEDGSLALDPLTGVVTTTRPFDAEALDRLMITVQAEGGILVDTAVVTVIILDQNDNTPTFDQTNYTRNIQETAREGTFIHSLFAQDADRGLNGVFSYKIVDGNIGDLFTIGSTSGVVTLARPLSSLPEPVSEFELVISACDMGTPSRASNVTVYVTVGADSNMGPVFLYPQPGQILELPENQPAGYEIVCLNATNPNGAVFYEFFTAGTANTNYRLFTLNRTTGKLRSNFVADRENVSSYTFFVLATDEGLPSPRVTPLEITIAISDEDDEEPAFYPKGGTPEDQVLDVDENVGTSTIIGTITPAVDPDINSTVYYCIVGNNDDGLFQIDITTGEIRTTGGLDFETQTTHNLIVKAINNDSCDGVDMTELDPANDRTLKRVVVVVGNVDDSAPMFLEQDLIAGVSIDSAIGSSVITVRVIDPETGLPANVDYRIKQGDFIREGEDPVPANNIFTIEEATGRIITQSMFTASDLDGVFQLVVGARDRTTLEDVCATVEIQVFDANQQVVIIIDEPFPIVSSAANREMLIRTLMNITGGIVRIEQITEVVGSGGTQTRVVFHVIDRETNQLLNSATVLNLIDASGESIDTLLIQGNVVDTFPVGATGPVGGIGLLGALLLLLALLLLIAALLFIILLCCLPRWGRMGHAAEKGAVVAAAAGSGKDSADGTYTAYNRGSWSLDKEFEAQEQTMNFAADNAFQVDKAEEALLMTPFVGGVANGEAYGGHRERASYRRIDNGGVTRSSMRSSTRSGHHHYDSAAQYNQVGVTHGDGSVSVQTDESDGTIGGTFPRVQETSFIERQQSSTRSGVGTGGRGQQNGMTTNYVDRDRIKKHTAAEVREMLGSQGNQQMSTSTAQFDDLNRSISVLVGYDKETTETRHSSSRKMRRPNQNGYDNHAYDEAADRQQVEEANRRRQETQRMFQEKLEEYEEENARLEEERRYTEQMVNAEIQPRRQEIVEEIYIYDQGEPFIGEREGDRGRDSLDDNSSVSSQDNSYSEEEYAIGPESNYGIMRSHSSREYAVGPESNYGTMRSHSSLDYAVGPESNFGTMRSHSSRGSGFEGGVEMTMETSHVERKRYQINNGSGPAGFFERHSGL